MTQFIHIKKLSNSPYVKMPEYATIHSAGMDLCAAIEENIVLKPMERKLIPTGIAIALPEGFEAQIRPRSGLALKHGISIPNSPGTIDADYRGEIGVILINLGEDDYTILPGAKIAQMVVARYIRVHWMLVDELSDTDRGTGGFGSTGTGL